MEYPMTMLKIEIGAPTQRADRHWLARHGDLLALVAIAAAPGVLLIWLLPLSFVLPVLSIVSFVLACIAGLCAYGNKISRRAPGMTLWDVAGVFTAMWIVAGILSGPTRFFKLFECLAASTL
jgi:hypothetical protein